MVAFGQMRVLARAVAVLAFVYALAVGVLWFAMRRPPDQFTRFMARMPPPAMMALPFRPLWLQARSGTLRVGDLAPDFELDTLDRTARVRLGSLRGEKPVVLVFGSYT
jgi:hypothetical protein